MVLRPSRQQLDENPIQSGHPTALRGRNSPAKMSHVGVVQEVEVAAVPLPRLESLLTPERAALLARYAESARSLLAGRTVWNVNSTARGGGVAEMLQALVGYGRGAGVDTRWLVLDGSPAFYSITKRLHNRLHGVAGDDGDLGPDARSTYAAVQERSSAALNDYVRPGDVVMLHDPQTAGLVPDLRARGAHVVWRCHVGRDEHNAFTEQAWSFLHEFVSSADAFVFSRAAFAPAWITSNRIRVIPPSLDPFSPKNAPLSPDDVTDTVQRFAVLADGGALPPDARVVLQVSRWDRLKDMAGVLEGFVEHLSGLPEDVHLILAGPETSGVQDDPEAADVVRDCRALWRGLTPSARARVHLWSLPMQNLDENAHLVNALQRYASVVVQKSLAEGFGLTVTEPMWKARPVVASAVGGIQDQIVDGVSGLLLRDPRDHADLAAALLQMLIHPDAAVAIGTAAHARVRDRFLADRHLIQYVDLFQTLLHGTT
jgi:trehalose synthase